MRGRRAAAWALAVTLAAVAGCTTPTGTACGADGTGAITFATVKNLSGDQREELTRRWNAAHPAEPVEIVVLPATADQQRAELSASLQIAARSGAGLDGYDVVGMDVIFLPEFARGGYLEPLAPQRFRTAGFLSVPWDSSFHAGDLYAVPFTTNVGLLYYWADELERMGVIADRRTPWQPGDWQSVREVARDSQLDGVPGPAGYTGQLAPYEGLTANVLELIWAQGGDLPTATDPVSDAQLDAAALGVDFLLDGVRNRWIDESALGFDEQDSLQAFGSRKVLVMRHWPDAYPALAARTGGTLGVARLPGERSTVLGGESVAVARCSPHRESAREFLSFLTAPEQQTWLFRTGLYLPTVEGLYLNGSLAGDLLAPEFVALLHDSIEDARPRPADPAYDRTSRLIRTEIHRALERSADETVDANDLIADLAGKLG